MSHRQLADQSPAHHFSKIPGLVHQTGSSHAFRVGQVQKFRQGGEGGLGIQLAVLKPDQYTVLEEPVLPVDQIAAVQHT